MGWTPAMAILLRSLGVLPRSLCPPLLLLLLPPPLWGLGVAEGELPVLADRLGETSSLETRALEGMSICFIVLAVVAAAAATGVAALGGTTAAEEAG